MPTLADLAAGYIPQPQAGGMSLSDLAKLTRAQIMSEPRSLTPIDPQARPGRAIDAIAGISINPTNWQQFLEAAPLSPNVIDQRDREADYYNELWNRSLKNGPRDKQLTLKEREWLVDYGSGKNDKFNDRWPNEFLGRK